MTITNEWLVDVLGPAGLWEYQASHGTKGLLDDLWDPKGGRHSFTYDADGRPLPGELAERAARR